MRCGAEQSQRYLLLLLSLCHPCLVLSGDDTHTQGKLPINSLLSLTFNKSEFIYTSSDKGINRVKIQKDVFVIQLFRAGRAQQVENTKNGNKEIGCMCVEKQTTCDHITTLVVHTIGRATSRRRWKKTGRRRRKIREYSWKCSDL